MLIDFTTPAVYDNLIFISDFLFSIFSSTWDRIYPYPGCQSLRESKDEERGKENAKENGRGKGSLPFTSPILHPLTL